MHHYNVVLSCKGQCDRDSPLESGVGCLHLQERASFQNAQGTHRLDRKEETGHAISYHSMNRQIITLLLHVGCFRTTT